MIDKIVILNATTALILYSHRKPVVLYSGDQEIELFLSWFLHENVHITFIEFKAGMETFNEDTIGVRNVS